LVAITALVIAHAALLEHQRHAVGEADQADRLVGGAHQHLFVHLLRFSCGHDLAAVGHLQRVAGLAVGDADLDRERVAAVDHGLARRRHVEVGFDLLLEAGDDQLLADRRDARQSAAP
jgi:hypothetical protein